jgi:hypothetical protein
MPTAWLTPLDHYCERIDAGFWAEPLNALSNGSFLLAAACALRLWRREATNDGAALWLILVATVVGIGSFLFHTLANRWSLLADVLPIAVFIYSYFLLAMRRYLGFGLFAAVAATGLFLAFSLVFDRVWSSVLPGVTLNGSVGYIPALLALFGIGALCVASGRTRAGSSLLTAGGLLTLSLVFRSLDRAACATVPLGTHFVWHLLNGWVLFILMRAAIADRARDRARPVVR